MSELEAASTEKDKVLKERLEELKACQDLVVVELQKRQSAEEQLEASKKEVQALTAKLASQENEAKKRSEKDPPDRPIRRAERRDQKVEFSRASAVSHS